MRIAYPDPVPVTLIYDSAFEVHVHEDGSFSWGGLMLTIKEDIDKYGFDECKVINSKTGELLMVIVDD